MNLYGFAGGDAVNFSDPLGLSAEPNETAEATEDPPVTLGAKWTARLDRFNVGGVARHEIHVFNPAGAEVGVFGQDGWSVPVQRECDSWVGCLMHYDRWIRRGVGVGWGG